MSLTCGTVGFSKKPVIPTDHREGKIRFGVGHKEEKTKGQHFVNNPRFSLNFRMICSRLSFETVRAPLYSSITSLHNGCRPSLPLSRFFLWNSHLTPAQIFAEGSRSCCFVNRAPSGFFFSVDSNQNLIRSR